MRRSALSSILTELSLSFLALSATFSLCVSIAAAVDLFAMMKPEIKCGRRLAEKLCRFLGGL